MSFRNYYDTPSYGRNRNAGKSTISASTERPTTVTAKYINSNLSYKSSSIPVLSNDRIIREETPISAVTNRYSNYNKADKSVSKYEKKDFNKLLVPPTITNRSRDVSPVSISKYGFSRVSRHVSPDKRTTKSVKDKRRDSSPIDRDKDIPSKTDKSTSYSSLSNYKLYPRTTNYTTSSSRTDTKPDITVNRYAIASRLSTNYVKSPTPVKKCSISSNNYIDSNKTTTDKDFSPQIAEENVTKQEKETQLRNNETENETNGNSRIDNDTETITVITRHTSPTPPGSSAYVRSRRAELAKTIEKTITRLIKRPKMIDKEIQSDRLDDTTRLSRFGSTSRTSLTNWSYYSPTSHNYTGYAGRYSTQYLNLRDNTSNNNNDIKSRSHSVEPEPIKESKDRTGTSSSDNISTYQEKTDDEGSEIIINVNLKLKKAKIPLAGAELVSPEITIANSQLPPQAPKSDMSNKIKKNKTRKLSSDSSSDTGSKKKSIKKRSKSASSTDSDHCNDIKDEHIQTSTKATSKLLSKSGSSTNITNSSLKLKHSRSRENNSPESSITLSTQSSVSEEESKYKKEEFSTTADRQTKQLSSVKSHKSEGGTEEAKSFLIRALAPVTSLFKLRQQDPSENTQWLENSTSESTNKNTTNLIPDNDKPSTIKNNTDNIVASNDDNLIRLKSIRSIESSENIWWQESNSNKDINHKNDMLHLNESGHKNLNQKHQMSSDKHSDSMRSLIKHTFVDEEKPWWLDSSADIPEGIERLTPPRKSSSDSDKSEKFNNFKVQHTESGEQKDWWLTSDNSSRNNIADTQDNLNRSNSDNKKFPLRRLRHVKSGERPWWLSSDKNIPEHVEKLPTPPPPEDGESSDFEGENIYIHSSPTPAFPLHIPANEPLGDRRSPEGLETPNENENYKGRSSPYENNFINSSHTTYSKSSEKYISRYTDIDDILGTSGQVYSPFMDSILARRTGQIPLEDDECEEIDPKQVRIHDSTPQRPVITKLRSRSDIVEYRNADQLDDVTLQVFKDGDYGAYLDLDSTLGEQDEELEGLQENRKNALILRTQLSVRVHAIIERLIHSQGRELRRALFTLKQILQSDKDLVHEFVANKGLDYLMQVGNMADHNYLDYILRALGQILLYVDGMHGVMTNKRCVQWLYSLIISKYRHVVKTALKLLLVFVEYTDKNCLLLIDAINVVDNSNGRQPWYNIMKILQDFDASDTELLIYATTLINRCLNNVPDRNTYYDQVDALQDQGMDDIIQLYMSKQGTDLDLLRQLQIFEAVLLYEDGDETGTALKQLDDAVINLVRSRSINLNLSERRKSKKYQIKDKAKAGSLTEMEPETKISNSLRSSLLPTIIDNKENKELSSALKRRRDRFARQAHHIIQQQELLNTSSDIYNSIFGTNKDFKSSSVKFTNTNGSITNSNSSYSNSNGNYINTIGNINGQMHYNTNEMNEHVEEEKNYLNKVPKTLNLPDVLKNGNQKYTTGLKQRIQNGTLGHSVNANDTLATLRQKAIDVPSDVKEDLGIIINREHSIKDLAQMLTTSTSISAEDKQLRVADMAGIVLKAKEELAKSQSKEIVKSPNIEKSAKVHEIKVSENDLHWEELKKGGLKREFHLCDLDFSDLRLDSDDEMTSPSMNSGSGPPPPPPNMFPPLGVPPPLPNSVSHTSKQNGTQAPRSLPLQLSSECENGTIKKNKKTVKLFWREIQENPIPITIRSKLGFIWDELPEVSLDTTTLEHLFESRTNDLMIKVFGDFPASTIKGKIHGTKEKCNTGRKRSNAINIAMKKLPTPQTIKAAIMKMDATVIGREGIEKLLTMLPTEEEKVKIQEAQYANPDLPLGSAEQFLLTLASINELSSRLKLWVFKLDFDNLEKEIAEPLMDLKLGIELLRVNKTFKVILSTLRSVGSFLNGSQVKGFRLEYLSKVMEVKDTVHKHPLLYHICEMIIEKFPDSTDFFSEVGPVIRASKVDFDVLGTNLQKLESDCKASWDHMKRVAKHDSSQIFKTKISEFLTDAAERIILLSVIKNRVMSRYSKLLLFLGVPPSDVPKTKPLDFLKVIAEFALEYRTMRERVLQQLEKRANHRERNKTRGKMIIDVGNYSNKSGDHVADTALKELLKTDSETDNLTEGRRKSQSTNNKIGLVNGDLTADDEIIESLVRSATTKRNSNARQRRKNRISDKKYFNRTLDGHQSWPGRESNSGTTDSIQHR